MREATENHRKLPRTWLIAAASALATALFIAAALAIAWRFPSFRERLGVPSPPAPIAARPDAPSLRRLVLAERDSAAARGDLVRVAMIHATLAGEAQQRAAAVQRAWMAKRDAGTLLFPESPEQPRWSYRNTAADCFGFLIHTELALPSTDAGEDDLPELKQTLAAEAKLSAAGQLCQPVDAHSGKIVEENHEQRIFGASEYVKDGLLSVYERWGPDPIGPRMIAVLDAVLANSQHQSQFGALPGGGSEENGNILQACSRLSFALKRDDYAELCARITDAAVMQMLPINAGVPARRFDYSIGAGKVLRADAKTRDHGSEIIPGLSESFALAVARSPSEGKWKERADRWADPLARMYETILSKARDSRGLLIGAVDPAKNFAHIDGKPSDNWGYILNGVLLFTQAARRHGQIDPARLDALDSIADAVIDAVVQQRNIDWERGHMDGYADTLESAIYMSAYRPSRVAVLVPWIDDQIENLFARQRPDGLINGEYLDGNFIRTALLYAELRTGGWRVTPWRPDVRVGFAEDRRGNVVVVVSSTAPYAGKLLPDTARHRSIMNLPWNWPRLNSWPEWFVIDEKTRVTDAQGVANPPAIAALSNGWPLSLGAGETVVLKMSR